MTSPTPRLLDGLTVLDVSRVFAGPHATMLLADLGATVWKLEPPDGDETRGWGPPFWGDPADRRSAYFAAVNRNKRSIVVNLKTDAGREVLDRLADRADLLMHNYLPSVAERLGLGPDRLRARHPGLVVSVVGGFPGTGPMAERPAYDLVAQAWSGQMAVTGEPGGGPIKIGVGLLDLLAGLEAAVAALAALMARERSPGAGAHTSVSLVEAATAGLTNILGYYLATGQEPRRWGTGHPDIVPYQVFATRDGHVVVAVGNDGQFARLCTLLGMAPPSRMGDESRSDHRTAMPCWPPWSRSSPAWDRAELVAAMIEADIPGGPVHDVGEAVEAMRALDPAWITTLDGIPMPASPIRVEGARLGIDRPPPLLGEHTDEILREAGFGDDEVAQLRAAAAIS